MSDVITKPGRYQHRRNREAEVFAERDGVWFGRFLSNCGDWMPGRWKSNGAGHCGTPCIIGPWHAFSVGDTVLVNNPYSSWHKCYGTVVAVRERDVDVEFRNGDRRRFDAVEAHITKITLPVPVPEGWRLKPRNVKPVLGDKGHLADGGWFDVLGDYVEFTAEQLDAKYKHCAPYFFIEPIPPAIPATPEPLGRVEKPFSISTNGPGVYLARGGREIPIIGRLQDLWMGELNCDTPTWADDGSWVSCSHDYDLVRYLRPLPQPEPQFKVGDRVRVKADTNEHRVVRGKSGTIVEHWNAANGWTAVKIDGQGATLGFYLKWANLEPCVESEPTGFTCTNEFRDRILNRDAGGPLPEGTTHRVVNGKWALVVTEQRWTNGTDVEWRPVPVETGTAASAAE